MRFSKFQIKCHDWLRIFESYSDGWNDKAQVQ